MSKQTSQEKHFLNLAGEYGVCSELAKRRINASITYGNHKAADIFVIDNNKKAYAIEVKTTDKTKFVTGFFQKFPTPQTDHPDFWVLVYIDIAGRSRFFILTHKDIADIQMKRNKMSSWHEVNGVDNIQLDEVIMYENRWDIITYAIK